jgi:4-hydroxy-3-polyprenylbenzoate decarboxylase
MPEQSIRPLIAALESAGRLARVSRPVDPAAHLAAVAAKALDERGQAVLFADATGWRVAAQLLTGRAQWAAALGIAEPDLLATLERRMRSPIEPASVTAAAAPVATQRLDGAALRLERLPVARMASGDDAAQFVAVAIATDPDTGAQAIGLTRHHVAGRDRVSLIGMTPSLAALVDRARCAERTLPMTLAIGADPALYLAAALATWRGADVALAGGLAGAPVKLLRDGAAFVPAEAEIVIVGEVSPTGTVSPGSLVNPFGIAAPVGAVPVLSVSRVLHRADPVFYAMQTGPSSDHATTLCLAAEALVAAHIRQIEGGIDFIDIRCPPAACTEVVVLKLRGRMEGQTKTALMGALSGAANWIKLAVAVDEDVDPGDLRDVFWSIASRTHAERDVGMIDGMRAHPDDPAARVDGDGARTATRWFIDSTMPPLTQPKRREDFARAIPKNLSVTDLRAILPKG